MEKETREFLIPVRVTFSEKNKIKSPPPPKSQHKYMYRRCYFIINLGGLSTQNINNEYCAEFK